MSNQTFERERSRSAGGKGAGSSRSRVSGGGTAREQQGGTSSTITSEVQGALDQQVIRGARMMTNVANSARRAAEELEADAPQIAGLVRGVADRVEEYSRNLENQSVTDLYQAAADFTRRQPSLVFGVAALTGFFALRTLKSSQQSSEGVTRTTHQRAEEFHGS
jgi:ElaB/YqjD/DUF883 family membrane-anchored ribosome-binding protein